MKKQTFWISLILVAMFAAAAVSTRAQASYGVRADVPFDFVVGDKTIPAGPIFAYGASEAVRGSLAIKNVNQGELALRAGHKVLGSERSNQGKLVFHKYGDRYFLAQICIPGNQTWEIMKSKEERSLYRDMRLVKNFTPERVIVAATID
jgi:hypothetical protein